MKYRQFRILQAVSFMTNIPTYSHKGHAASNVATQLLGESDTDQHKNTIYQNARATTVKNYHRGSQNVLQPVTPGLVTPL